MLRKIIISSLLLLFMAEPCSAERTTIEQAGDLGRAALPTIALLTTLAHHDREGLQPLAYSVGTSLATVWILKRTVKERRPRDPQSLHSFPSGHATWAFVSASYLQRRYGWAAGIPAYAAASFVAYTRLRVRAHHTHDVLVGAALGIGANLIFTQPWHGHAVSVQPTLSADGAGLAISMTPLR